ncbi:MAG: hypothetical protein GF364_16780 [Candidatus Lokiarchaeota archaeon]|nr:hypothetical protein [Candidatus Lokiarchaeota archaeon]
MKWQWFSKNKFGVILCLVYLVSLFFIPHNEEIFNEDELAISNAKTSRLSNPGELIPSKFADENYFSPINGTWGSSLPDEAKKVCYNSGYLYATGYSRVSLAIGDNAFLTKFDTNGDLIWNKTYGDSNDEVQGQGVVVDSNGNIYVVGTEGEDLILLKYSSAGGLLWAKNWGETDRTERCWDVVLDANNNLYVAGEVYISGSSYQALLVKFDSSGSFQWERIWGGSLEDYGYGVVLDSNNNIFLTGLTESYGSGHFDLFLVKWDSTGTYQWEEYCGTEDKDFGYGINCDPSDNIYVTGELNRDYGVLLKYSNSGEQLWNKTWQGQFGTDIAFDGNILYVSAYDSIKKFNSDGNFIWSWSAASNRLDLYGIDCDMDGNVYTAASENSVEGENIAAMIFKDTDDDDLTDGYEMGIGTEVNDNDSDDDTYSDYDEIAVYGTDPLDENDYPGAPQPDADNDGIPDAEETVEGEDGYITDPNDNDTDNDDLEDGYEIDTSLTDPTDSDTDDDQMPDGYEVQKSLDPKTDDSGEDPDSDDLTNLEEYTLGTEPKNADTDDDGMPDGWENLYNLDPLDDSDAAADADSDGITNLQEYLDGTNPIGSDTDGDGMDDAWEEEHGTDPTVNDANDDDDSDGLTNFEEYTEGTNPQKEDTDDDGMNDLWEVENNTNPTTKDDTNDPDTDGLTNINEMTEGTNPHDPDSDDDGLTDGDEINSHNTDPLSVDSDSDTMDDLFEITYGLDPNVADAHLDPDNDNLTNVKEYQLNCKPNNNDTDTDDLSDGQEVLGIFCPNNPYSNTTGYLLTNPLKSDSDNDTLTDWEEIFEGVDGFCSNPNAPDSDNDQLNDYEEVRLGSDGYVTNPNNEDTDSDQLTDYWEVTNGTDPTINDAAEDPDADGLTNLNESEIGTDPLCNDTDADEMIDGWEYVNELNPLQDDAMEDPDADGLTNLQEFNLNTNPQSEDTDGDFLPDKWEHGNSTNPIVADAEEDPDSDGLTNYDEFLNGTDPQNADSDGDGLTDSEEINLYQTDPNKADSDNDGASDYSEVTQGNDPNNPEDNPARDRRNRLIILITIGTALTLMLVASLTFYFKWRNSPKQKVIRSLKTMKAEMMAPKSAPKLARGFDEPDIKISLNELYSLHETDIRFSELKQIVKELHEKKKYIILQDNHIWLLTVDDLLEKIEKIEDYIKDKSAIDAVKATELVIQTERIQALCQELQLNELLKITKELEDNLHEKIKYSAN